MRTDTVTQNTAAPGFVECDIVLNSGAESLEHSARIVRKISHKLVLVQ